MSRSRLRTAGAVLLFWVVTPLVGTEILMTVLEPWLFHGFYQYDRQMGFRVRAHANGTNEFGFNDRDYPPIKPPATTRLLFVGDSFSWCGGKDGNYTARLERLFEQEGRRVEVINAGYPMTHTAEQLAMLKRFDLPYDPDLVVLAFFAGNDFYDADPSRRRIVVNDLYVDVDPAHELHLFGLPIVPRSRLWLFLRQKLRIHSALDQAGRGTGVPGETALFTEDEYLSLVTARLDFFDLRMFRAGAYRRNIDLILASLRGMNEFVRGRGKSFLVVLIPADFQVDPRLQAKLFGSWGLKREDYDLDLAQKLVLREAEPLGIPVIDLLPRFTEEEKTVPHYVAGDGHWNAEGNRLAAELLLEKLGAYLPRGGEAGAPPGPR